MASVRRYWSHDRKAVFTAQSYLAGCLDELGRYDEALVLKREVHNEFVALFGDSHENTIVSGINIAVSLLNLGLCDESKFLLRDKLLPVARRSLGADHALTLKLNTNLAYGLQKDPERTRDDPCFNQHPPARRVDNTQATTF